MNSLLEINIPLLRKDKMENVKVEKKYFEQEIIDAMVVQIEKRLGMKCKVVQ